MSKKKFDINTTNDSGNSLNTDEVSSDAKLKRNIELYISSQPFVGLIISMGLGIIFMVSKSEWSVSMLLYTLLPIIFLTIEYIVIYIFLHNKLNLVPCFLKGIWLYVTIGILLLFVAMNILFYTSNSNRSYNIISLTQLEQNLLEDKATSTLFPYYVIFGSENCYICSQMEDVYINSFSRSNLTNPDYCDLTNESIYDDFITDLKIHNIPVLIQFMNGEEVKRISGMKTAADIIEFLK